MKALFCTPLLAITTLCLFSIACKKDAKQPPVQPPPPDTTDVRPEGKTGPLNAVYIEVNNNYFANAKCYTMKTGGQPFFDIAIIFAANINYDTQAKKAVLYNNPNVTTVLNNHAAYIQPLQDKGIKVLLSVLGNHQGAGFANFTSRAAANAFAQQLSDAVTAYELDGIDFDDEYAEYGKNGLPQPNDSSFILLLDELRKLMPGKIISLYNIGPAAAHSSWNGKKTGDYINYAWNPYYGTYAPPVLAGMTKGQLGPAAIWINHTSLSTAANLAQRTMNDGYGVVLYYDLPRSDVKNYLSRTALITQKDSVNTTPDCLR
ncbi:endo-beta-N-acetylglucosaminidase H [uncultured Chitinophaga sp.]|jgi:Chitinase|uniref:endo-beta-N-acetylglucosaminidase H n=1 Tax=uncultured Chitinophaga sp. TaxID=339340 RepID=UPI0026105AF8|nr:endo-beta-N-acetylglucosaminidase H [uncultured Chitinophaga sp.]